MVRKCFLVFHAGVQCESHIGFPSEFRAWETWPKYDQTIHSPDDKSWALNLVRVGRSCNTGTLPLGQIGD